MKIPLRLGPLKAEGYNIHCSGVRWLCESGQRCEANQPIAYFNLNLEPSGSQPNRTVQFFDEKHLQVVCAPRVAGRLSYDSGGPGGYLSILGINLWDPDAVLALDSAQKWAGPLTPLGGLFLIVGWSWLWISLIKKPTI